MNIHTRPQLHIFAAEARLFAQSIRELSSQFTVPGSAYGGESREGSGGLLFAFLGGPPFHTRHIADHGAGVIDHRELVFDSDAWNVADGKGAAAVAERDFFFKREFAENIFGELHCLFVGYVCRTRPEGGCSE